MSLHIHVLGEEARVTDRELQNEWTRSKKVLDARDVPARFPVMSIRYKIEVRYSGLDRYSAFIRRPDASSIAIGVGCGGSIAAAVRSAREEVRIRRLAGEFR